MGKLTAAFVRHAKPGRYGDGRGLYLQVEGGSQLWVYRYEFRKRERWMSIGSAEFITLAQARERTFELRRKLKDEKVDPLEQRKVLQAGARVAALTGTSFEQLARRYVDEVRSKKKQWRGDKSRREWLSTLERFAFPVIGSLPVNLINDALVHQVLDPVWTKKPHVGQRLRERIAAVLEFGKSRGLRKGENPARWRGHLENSYAVAAASKNHPALPFAEVPAFMAELRELPGIAARALEFLILTAARTGEVRGALWSEIDLATGIWTVPGERMKAGKPHRVPLTERALALLRELPDGDAVFPGRSGGGVLDQDAMAEVSAKLRPGEAAWLPLDVPGWAARPRTTRTTSLEMALANAIPSGVEPPTTRGSF